MDSSKHSFRFGLSELLLIVFVLFSGVMLAFHSGGFVISVQKVGFTVLSSLQKGVNAVTSGVGETVNAVHELARLREENRELIETIDRYSDGLIVTSALTEITETLSAAKAPKRDGKGNPYPDIEKKMNASKSSLIFPCSFRKRIILQKSSDEILTASILRLPSTREAATVSERTCRCLPFRAASSVL